MIKGFFERLRLAGSEPWSSSGCASISPMVSAGSCGVITWVAETSWGAVPSGITEVRAVAGSVPVCGAVPVRESNSGGAGGAGMAPTSAGAVGSSVSPPVPTSAGLRYCHASIGRFAVSCCSSCRASDASAGRASTARAVKCETKSATCWLMPGQVEVRDGTSSCTCLNTMVTGLSDVNGTSPASISQAMIPTEYRSPCMVALLSSIISGARYAAVPSSMPVVDSVACDAAFARPKSVICTCPRSLIRMFSGLMSRWTTPTRCAAASPSSVSEMTRSISRTLNVPCRFMS